MNVPPALPGNDAQARLTIDLDALTANWRLLAARAAPAECGAVVKADAYGTGIERSVPALARAGCRTFFTAHVSEGARARASLRAAGVPDTVRIFILNGFSPAAVPVGAYRAAALGPVLCSMAQLEAWGALGGADGAPSALHVDTGMNRAGLDLADIGRVASAQLAAAGVQVLMSHFVAAEEPGNPISGIQIDRFEAARAALAMPLPASLANSSGLMLDSRPVYDLTRPGYALYGGNPTPGRPNPMRPVVGLAATILQTRWIAAGEPVGYNGRWIAPRRTRLATIGVGYADGLPRNAMTIGAGHGPVTLAHGVPCPLVGRVSMDLSLVDITDAPEDLSEGSMLELLGATITVDDLGAQTGTIGYEILTSLGRRYARTYIGG